MEKSVFCIAKNIQTADQIVKDLKAAGFPEAAISILTADKRNEGKDWTGMGKELPAREFKGKNEDFTMRDEEEATFQDESRRFREGPVQDVHAGGLGHRKNTKAPEGAAIGGTAGGILGGTLGLLAGIGALAIPGVGPFIAAGPLLGALAGSAVGGSIGLLTGALVGLGIPEYEAVRFTELLKNGNTVLISVHAVTSEEVSKAKDIFDKDGAEDIACSKETSVSSGEKKNPNKKYY